MLSENTRPGFGRIGLLHRHMIQSAFLGSMGAVGGARNHENRGVRVVIIIAESNAPKRIVSIQRLKAPIGGKAIPKVSTLPFQTANFTLFT